MRSKIPHINIGYYVNMKTVEAVHKALDIPLGKTIMSNKMNGMNGMNGVMQDEEEGEIVEEEVADIYGQDDII